LPGVRDLHEAFGYVTVVANGLVGVWGIVAWRLPRLRGRPLWVATIAAEGTVLITVVLGTILVAAQDFEPSEIHMFYGFVAFATVGGMYGYKYLWKARGWLELAYGLGGLFLMGLAIRAILEA